jgi:hypothetical protein
MRLLSVQQHILAQWGASGLVIGGAVATLDPPATMKRADLR